ncbi:hypothetical protein LEP1GSC038_1841 [Leptospira weilii str. 2006001855]|uniref:Uncharacterized protein n=1 Tax=Leptospira weilii str. 2006001855 TaxID=996804 RepID=M6FRU3_9LEPT|nr:hypothetical protein LEP1GSC038_1841 [Leptospira weilii str. 2006001855]EMN43864.1 hypothetical protein LEP1GSC086_4619 [Leptospira weilii str. LNT 1234]
MEKVNIQNGNEIRACPTPIKYRQLSTNPAFRRRILDALFYRDE